MNGIVALIQSGRKGPLRVLSEQNERILNTGVAVDEGIVTSILKAHNFDIVGLDMRNRPVERLTLHDECVMNEAVANVVGATIHGFPHCLWRRFCCVERPDK